ncbi:MAG TPA: transketolase [Alphaproteobacteria bacterium]|nr:transketolase [Alphaproteobacteria bacterium]
MSFVEKAPLVESTVAIAALERKARRVRATCLVMAHQGREGHLTSALSCVDILVALYGGWLNVSPSRPRDPHRDRFLFSKGHAASAYYAVMADAGFLPVEELATYGKSGSRLPSHPCRLMLPCLEISSGSLGHGLGMGTGMMYGMALSGHRGRVVVLMSDGECNEGSVWEAAAFACAHKQERLIAIVDNNDMQAVGRTDQLMGGATFEDKFRAFGWGVRTVNGNNIAEIRAVLDEAPFVRGQPSAIVAKTVGGAGVSFMADDTLWHYRVPSKEDLRKALEEIGAPPFIEVGP